MLIRGEPRAAHAYCRMFTVERKRFDYARTGAAEVAAAQECTPLAGEERGASLNPS